MYFDLHRHDEYSTFDGFGKPVELAKRAKELGYKALGTSNHGNTSGLVQHWLACKEANIKPILGTEIYFQPVFNKKEPKRKKYHLCLFAKNLEGYRNLNRIVSEANINNFYYTGTVDFSILEKYHEGIICTSACIAGVVSQAIQAKNIDMAKKLLNKFVTIFGDDFYIEIQPFKIDDIGTQQKNDRVLMELSDELDIPCILTSDSHFCKKEDFDTYCKLHEIGKTKLDVKKTYSERYMPSGKEMRQRFLNIYSKLYGKEEATERANFYMRTLDKLQEKVEPDYMSQIKLELPKYDCSNSKVQLRKMTQEGLKKRGKYKKEYIERCIKELDVINYHGFNDYFLMVQDYVNYARQHNVIVGDGRGSACNCLVAYAIGITDVDSLEYKLDFSRFMRKEKKKLPDIDVDFETDKRQSVIDYVLEKHSGKSVQISSYGEYSLDNLVNDLSKVCGLPTTGRELDASEKEENKKIIADIKQHINTFKKDGKIDMVSLLEDLKTIDYNKDYDNIIKHFSKMYGKLRHFGTHAAGVAVVGTNIMDYTAIMRRGDRFYSAYDLNDLEHINCTKFDMLGLKTLSELKELKELSGKVPSDTDLRDNIIYDEFYKGNTDGIFQMEKNAPKKILSLIHCDSINDVIAVNALNRPAPLKLKMHETYAYNKLSGEAKKDSPYYKYTQDTYGTMLYQEQTVEVAQKLGHLSPEQSFDMLKIMKKPENLNKPEYIPKIEQMKKDFLKGCNKEGITEDEALEIWGSMLIYGFNKGHSTGYALISLKQMYYKIHCPIFYWYVKMKYANSDSEIYKFSMFAAKDGMIVMLPHVNYTALTSIRKQDGEFVIQQGTSVLKDVGEKAAKAIEEERRKNGLFKDYDDFYDRCYGNGVNKRVLRALEESGALQFDYNKWLKYVIKYNSSLYAR